MPQQTTYGPEDVLKDTFGPEDVLETSGTGGGYFVPASAPRPTITPLPSAWRGLTELGPPQQTPLQQLTPPHMQPPPNTYGPEDVAGPDPDWNQPFQLPPQPDAWQQPFTLPEALRAVPQGIAYPPRTGGAMPVLAKPPASLSSDLSQPVMPPPTGTAIPQAPSQDVPMPGLQASANPQGPALGGPPSQPWARPNPQGQFTGTPSVGMPSVQKSTATVPPGQVPVAPVGPPAPADFRPTTISPEAAEVLKWQREGGFMPEPYEDGGKRHKDGSQRYAIGYGMQTWKGQAVRPGLKITQEEADAEFLRQLEQNYKPIIDRELTRPVTQHQYDALLSVAWNHPTAAVKLAKRLNAGEQLTEADFLASATSEGKPHPGLQNRRRQEYAEFKTPDAPRAAAPVAPASTSDPALMTNPGEPVNTMSAATVTGKPKFDPTKPLMDPILDLDMIKAGKKVIGAIQPIADFINHPQPPERTMKAASDLVEGVFTLYTPAVATALVKAPATVTWGLIKTVLAGKIGEEGADAFGASEEGKRFTSNMAMVLAGGKSVNDFVNGHISTLTDFMAKWAAAKGRVWSLAGQLTRPGYGTGDVPGARGPEVFEERMTERAEREAREAREGAHKAEQAESAAEREKNPPPPRGPSTPIPSEVPTSIEARYETAKRLHDQQLEAERLQGKKLTPEQQAEREQIIKQLWEDVQAEREAIARGETPTPRKPSPPVAAPAPEVTQEGVTLETPTPTETATTPSPYAATPVVINAEREQEQTPPGAPVPVAPAMTPEQENAAKQEDIRRRMDEFFAGTIEAPPVAATPPVTDVPAGAPVPVAGKPDDTALSYEGFVDHYQSVKAKVDAPLFGGMGPVYETVLADLEQNYPDYFARMQASAPVPEAAPETSQTPLVRFADADVPVTPTPTASRPLQDLTDARLNELTTQGNKNERKLAAEEQAARQAATTPLDYGPDDVADAQGAAPTPAAQSDVPVTPPAAPPVKAPVPVKAAVGKSSWSTLDEKDRSEVIRSLGSVEGRRERWAKLVANGATDEEIRALLDSSYGLGGGSGDHWHLGGKHPRIDIGSIVTDDGVKPRIRIKGPALVATVREALNIPQPKEDTPAAPKAEGAPEGETLASIQFMDGEVTRESDRPSTRFDRLSVVDTALSENPEITGQLSNTQLDDYLDDITTMREAERYAPRTPWEDGAKDFLDDLEHTLEREVLRRAGQQGLGFDEGDADGHDGVDGGRKATPGQPGPPTGGTRGSRPPGVAGQQPRDESGVSEPDKPTIPRKPRAGSGGGGSGTGASAPSGGDESGGRPSGDAPADVDTADNVKDDTVHDAHARGEAPRHFVIDAAADLTSGGWTAKLEANMTAIRLLKQLQADGRPASADEQAILAQYIGWGHTELAPVVDLQQRLSEPRKVAARAELEQLLTARELQTVGLTTPNAHYSFHELPVAMWNLAQRLGFKGGTILEPAVGTGHFFGTMPGTILAHGRTRLFGVDMEPIAAGIAAQLYQSARIQNTPLQEAVLPLDYFDLHISNVPFGRIRVFDPAFVSSDRAPMTRSVHNYYFGKALDLARPGGIILFVTSRFTMDSENDSVRKYINDRAIFLGAIRLPNQTFEDTAGTQVVTDVIVLQKRGEGVTTEAAGPWLATKETARLHGPRGTDTFQTNEYFHAHPEMILGKQDATGKMARTGEPQYNVTGSVTPAQLAEAVARFPENVYKASTAKPRTIADKQNFDARQGSYIVKDGKLYVYDKGTLEPSTLTGSNLERAMAFVPMRDAYLKVLDANIQQATDAELKAAQKDLRKTYDAFVKKFGPVNKPENIIALEADPNSARVVTLENIERVQEKGKRAQIKVIGHADIFDKRLFSPPKEPTTATNAADALLTSRAWRGHVDLSWMSQLTGEPEAALTATLLNAGDLYQNPVTHAWEPKDEYLSGDVVTKLEQAKAAADLEPHYESNVEALKAVQPERITIDHFYAGGAGRSAPFGATWIPQDLLLDFLKATGGSDTLRLRLLNTDAKVAWYVEGYGTHEFRPVGMDYEKWVQYALNGHTPKVMVDDGTGKKVLDPKLTVELQQSIKQLREQWESWWKGQFDASDRIVQIYNAMFNRETQLKVDGDSLVLPNASPDIVLRKGQKDSVARTLARGNTLLAQAVGWGKTFEMIAIASEWKRRGLAHKPMIVVPNHLVEQWRRDFLRMYPSARVLITTKEDFEAKNRKRLIARIANNEWDAVVIGQTQFVRIGVKLETLRAFIDEQEQQLLAEGAEQVGMTVEAFSDAVDAYGNGDKKTAITARGTPKSAKDIARQILNLRAMLQKRINAQAKDPIEFEQLGVDGLIVDEAHNFKNLYFSTSHNNVVGLKGSASDRALDMYLKVRLINQQSGQRNIVFATATPIANTMSELYTMFRYLDMEGLRRLGISGFDSWMSGYAEAEGQMEPAPGGGFKERVRLRTWTNMQELYKLFARFSDVITRDEVVKQGLLKLPKEVTVTIETAAPAEMPAFMDRIKARIAALQTGKVSPKVDNHLWVANHASWAAIDLRLVPEVFGGISRFADAAPTGRIATAAKEIIARYRASKDFRGTQIVFLDLGVPSKAEMPPLPDSVLRGGPTVAVADETPDEDMGAEEDTADQQTAGATKFNLYDELVKSLVAQGMKRDEIVFMQQAEGAYELGKLFDAVRNGTVRVLITSREKGGTGMNVQDRVVAIHHVDVPWRPDQLEQANGRGIRQGNQNAEVEIVKYITPGSFDQYRWYLLGIKQGFISGFLRGEVSNMEDVDPAQLDMQLAAAVAANDSRVMDLINTERSIVGLRARAENFRRRNEQAKREVQLHIARVLALAKELESFQGVKDTIEAWANEGRPIVLDTKVIESRGYRHIEGGTAQTFKIDEKEGKAGLQAALVPFMTMPYLDPSGARIGTAGPYELRILPLSRTAIVVKDGKLTKEETRTIVLAVYHNDKLVGHSPEWDAEKPPDFSQSLGYWTGTDLLDKRLTQLHAAVKNTKEELADAKRLAGKTFDQSAQLEVMEKKLADLRVALGQEHLTSATQAQKDADDADDAGDDDGTSYSKGQYATPTGAKPKPAQKQTPTGAPIQQIQFPELVDFARLLMGTPQVVKSFRGDGAMGTFDEQRGIRLHRDLFKAGNEHELAAALAHELGHLVDWLPSRILKRGNLLGRLFTLRNFLKEKFVSPDGSTLSNKEIRAELIALSAMWRPWNQATATESFTKYRNSAKELYADAISVLLNDPELLEAEAPIFFKQFFEGLDTKPEVKQAYFDLLEVLAGSPEDLIVRRRAGVQAMFAHGDTAAMELERQREREKALSLRDLWSRFKIQTFDKNLPVVDRLKALEKAGIIINPDDDPRYMLEERAYLGAKLKAFTEQKFLPIYRAVLKAEIPWHIFGEALFYERIIAGDRSELANPRGIQPAVATDLLANLKKLLTPEQLVVLERDVVAFREVIADVAEEAYKAGLYTEKLYDQMLENPAYVTFRVIEHLENAVTSRVYRQIGTLKDITDPGDASMLKVIATLRAIEHQKVKLSTFKLLETFFPDEIEQAREVWKGNHLEVAESKDPKQHLITYYEQGRMRGKYVSEEIADSLNNLSVGQDHAIIASLRWVNSGLYRPVFTTMNLGFQSANFVRDFRRFWKAIPTMTLGRALKRYAQASPMAAVRAFGMVEPANRANRQVVATAKAAGLPGPKQQQPWQWQARAKGALEESEAAGILSITYNDLLRGRHIEDTQIEDTFARMGVGGIGTSKPSHALIRPVMGLLDFIKALGDFIETLPKAAAIIEYRGKGSIADIPADVRSHIRRKVGSPDYLMGGTYKAMTNELFIFSNAITQALRADYEVATQGAPAPPRRSVGSGAAGGGPLPPTGPSPGPVPVGAAPTGGAGPQPLTKSGFWWKTAATNILPKLLTFAAIYGIAANQSDEEDTPLQRLRRILRGASEYDLTNYNVVPIGIDEKGNAIYIRVPQDDSGRLLSGIAWKLLMGTTGERSALETALAVPMQIFSYIFGQAPGLTPALGAVKDVADFAAGRNVYDDFRGRFLFTDTEMKGDTATKGKKFLGYEFQQAGGNAIVKFYPGEMRPRDLSRGQQLLDLPFVTGTLGRWVRISNYGEVERYRRLQAQQQQAEATTSNAETKAINAALRAHQQRPESARRPEQYRVDAQRIFQEVHGKELLTPKEQLEKAKRIYTKLKMGDVRAGADALLDVVMSSPTNAQKIEVLRGAADEMSRTDFYAWLSAAVEADAISVEVANAAAGPRRAAMPVGAAR